MKININIQKLIYGSVQTMMNYGKYGQFMSIPCFYGDIGIQVIVFFFRFDIGWSRNVGNVAWQHRIEIH